MFRVKIRDEKGSVLIMAAVLSFATIIVGVAFITSAVNLQGMVNAEICRKQAKYDAYAGGLRGMAEAVVGRPHFGGWDSYYEDNWTDYRVIRRGENDIDYGTSSYLRVVGYGKSNVYEDNDQDEISIDYVYESYSDYLYLSDRERDSVRREIINFWTPDTLDGKVHSNDTIFIQPGFNDAPRFMRRVTTTMKRIYPPTNHAQFDSGWGYHGPIIFPDQAYEIRLNNGYPGLGTWDPDSITQITFSGNHFYLRYCGPFMHDSIPVIKCSPDFIEGSPGIDLPASGALFIHGKVWLSAARGTRTKMNRREWAQDTVLGPLGDFVSLGFNGQLTLASSDTMIIVDNVIYQNAKANRTVPTTMDSCPDLLGLISERYIMIGEDAGNVVYINAAMAAIRGSISVEDIYESMGPPGWDNERQSLFIYGSLAQKNRGLVHTTQHPPNHERGFIEKDYHYDVRLKENPPPHYLKSLATNLQFWEE